MTGTVEVMVRHPRGRPNDIRLTLLFLRPDGTGWKVEQPMSLEQAKQAAADIRYILK